MFKLFKVLFIAILPVLIIFTMAGSIGTRLMYDDQIKNGTMTEQQVNEIINNTPFFQKFVMGLGAYENIVGDTLLNRYVRVMTESNIFDSNNYSDTSLALQTIGSFLIFPIRFIYESVAFVINLFRWWDYAFTIRN